MRFFGDSPKRAQARARRALKRQVRLLGAIINAPDQDLVSFEMLDGAYPFAGVDEFGVYHWVVMERGQVLQDRQTTDRDEFLYWSFLATTSNMAQRWALHHPIEGQEQRVTTWIKQFELLHKLNPDWAQRHRDELVRSIKDVPGGIPRLPKPLPNSRA